MIAGSIRSVDWRTMIFFLFLFSCSSEPFPSSVSISWSGPLTGEYRDVGTDHLRGVMIAVDEINKAGGVVRGDGVCVRLEVKSYDSAVPTLNVPTGDIHVLVYSSGVILSQGSRQLEFPFEGVLSEEVLETYVRLYLASPKNNAVIASGYDVVQLLAKSVVVARSRERIVGGFI